MFAYEIHRMHHAELLREAAALRLSHEAARAAGGARRFGRRFGRRSGRHEDEGRVGAERGRFVRAA
ncbi:hypothetical protein ABZZ44_29630 [Streptomyces sp. NPDC006460]|uniref:hypothetical protein n=1 Tax=Streptomyces sp. NPDC006460 TaxID=3154304 RepID=UPI0033A5D559